MAGSGHQESHALGVQHHSCATQYEESHRLQVKSIPFQVGLPDHSEALEANLEYQLHASHGDLRGFLATAAEARDLGEFSDVLGEALRPDGVHAFALLWMRLPHAATPCSCSKALASRRLWYPYTDVIADDLCKSYV